MSKSIIASLLHVFRIREHSLLIDRPSPHRQLAQPPPPDHYFIQTSSSEFTVYPHPSHAPLSHLQAPLLCRRCKRPLYQ
jgi:hypothetical protein